MPASVSKPSDGFPVGGWGCSGPVSGSAAGAVWGLVLIEHRLPPGLFRPPPYGLTLSSQGTLAGCLDLHARADLEAPGPFRERRQRRRRRRRQGLVLGGRGPLLPTLLCSVSHGPTLAMPGPPCLDAGVSLIDDGIRPRGHRPAGLDGLPTQGTRSPSVRDLRSWGRRRTPRTKRNERGGDGSLDCGSRTPNVRSGGVGWPSSSTSS